MLKTNNLTLKPLFENIFLEKEKGIIGIFGPSGSGKTTFLKTIGGFIKAENGEVLFNNHKIQQGKILDSNFKLGFHFQDHKLLDLDVKTNIDLPFTIGGYKKDNNRINYLIKYFEIENLLNKNISKISGGEKERISIIKAFANKPNLILLDEAGAFLDEKLKKKLYSFIKEYSKDNLVILISHDKETLNYFSLIKRIYSKSFSIVI